MKGNVFKFLSLNGKRLQVSLEGSDSLNLFIRPEEGGVAPAVPRAWAVAALPAAQGPRAPRRGGQGVRQRCECLGERRFGY